MTKDEALKMALEYVELVPDDRYNAEHIDREALVTAIKEALAQPEQEPVAWVDDYNACKCPDNEARCFSDKVFRMMQKHTTPPQRKPLTDEEIGSCIDEVNLTSQYGHHHFGWHKQFARAIEAAHGIKGEA